jgi:hypothetical protein
LSSGAIIADSIVLSLGMISFTENSDMARKTVSEILKDGTKPEVREWLAAADIPELPEFVRIVCGGTRTSLFFGSGFAGLWIADPTRRFAR